MNPLELKAPRLVQQIEELAETLQRPAEQVLENAVEAYLDLLDREAIQAEPQAFWAMHDVLVQSYPGEHVAIRQGEVVDHDADLIGLEKRIRLRFGNAAVLIAPVNPALPRELAWRGGRLAERLQT